MKIGILMAGLLPDGLAAEHGQYDELYKRFLNEDDFEYDNYRVVENQFPASINAADGWLISGSKHGAYESHNWIPPLETFLRDAYDGGVPIVGICFGHQILAKALGGKVEKFSNGWSVGKQHYAMDGIKGGVDLMAWHQDQVVELPAGANVFGSSPFCKYAAITYGNTALSVQPHPEFDQAFVHSLFEYRKDTLPKEVMARQNDDHSGQLSNALIANMMVRVLKQEQIS